MSKQKIKLEKEKETLLIPLYSKAEESKKNRPILVDLRAVEMISQIDYNWSELKIPQKTKVSLCLRAKQLDDYVETFLQKHPEGSVIHLGCGLDSRCLRVDNGKVTWYDLDFPEVIELRRQFYEESERYHLIPSSVTDWGWLDNIKKRDGHYLFVAEGLFMYLKEMEVKGLLLKIKTLFPGSILVLDVFSTFTLKKINQHPSIKKTDADIHWGIDDATQIEGWQSGIKVVEEWFFAESPELKKLTWGYRLGFKIAGLFPVANKAHRILVVQL